MINISETFWNTPYRITVRIYLAVRSYLVLHFTEIKSVVYRLYFYDRIPITFIYLYIFKLGNFESLRVPKFEEKLNPQFPNWCNCSESSVHFHIRTFRRRTVLKRRKQIFPSPPQKKYPQDKLQIFRRKTWFSTPPPLRGCYSVICISWRNTRLISALDELLM